MQHSESLGVVLGANLCNILSRLELFWELIYATF
jgi:hypothetical protein